MYFASSSWSFQPTEIAFDKLGNILFGESPQISAFWRDIDGEESSLFVEWELVSKTVFSYPTEISDESLFKDTPVLLFTGGANPYKSETLEFQTVHIGKITLKAKSDLDEEKGTLEIEININKPIKLGNTYNQLEGPGNGMDDKIIFYAHKYGIPPQYLKGHVHQEAEKRDGKYLKDSFRYELIGWDYGKTISKGIYQWGDDEWQKYEISKLCFEYPNGTDITQKIEDLINDFYMITKIEENKKEPSKPIYRCSKYKDLNENAKLVGVYNANNGWGDGSYPNKLYKRRSPCGIRIG